MSYQLPFSQSELREKKLLSQYGGIVQSVVSRMKHHASPVVDCDDFQQIGLIALLHSIRKYKCEPDKSFESYAAVSVKNAICDELRRNDFRTRQSRKDSHSLSSAKNALEQLLARPPKRSELCQFLSVDDQELVKMELSEQLNGKNQFEDLINAMQSSDDIKSFSVDDPAGMVMTLQLLKKALNSLSDSQKKVMYLYHQNNLTIGQIADRLNVSPSRISQIYRSIVFFISSEIGKAI